jgi:hypothetical protein
VNSKPAHAAVPLESARQRPETQKKEKTRLAIRREPHTPVDTAAARMSEVAEARAVL